MLDTIDRIRITFAGDDAGHPAHIIDGRAGEYTARLESGPASLEPGTGLDVHYEELNELLRQPAVIVDVMTDDAGDRLVRFRTDGAPISQETRVCHRVAGAAEAVAATVAGVEACAVVDLSTTGLCCTASVRLDPEETVAVVLRYGGRAHAGRAIVRSVHAAGTGGFRYGLECTSDRESAELHKGLQIACMAIQRGLLRHPVAEA